MTVPQWISAIAALCGAALTAGKTLARGSQLGQRERDLLQSAAKDGQFVV